MSPDPSRRIGVPRVQQNLELIVIGMSKLADSLAESIRHTLPAPCSAKA